mgnify:CR=1 FL=1
MLQYIWTNSSVLILGKLDTKYTTWPSILGFIPSSLLAPPIYTIGSETDKYPLSFKAALFIVSASLKVPSVVPLKVSPLIVRSHLHVCYGLTF